MSAALRKRLEETTAALNRVQRLVTLEAAVQAVVAQHGGVRAAERATGVDKSFISRLMNGHRVEPSAETLEALGLRAVPLYEVLKRPNVANEAGQTAAPLLATPTNRPAV